MAMRNGHDGRWELEMTSHSFMGQSCKGAGRAGRGPSAPRNDRIRLKSHRGTRASFSNDDIK